MLLRAFQDSVLSKWTAGKIVMWIYDQIGPIAARAIEAIPVMKPICRRILDLIIAHIENKTDLRREHFRKEKQR
jgi:hypothetical protein